VHFEVGYAISDFSRRDITLLPVRLDDKLAKIIGVVPEVDFKKLNPQKFESLVGELLWKTGFENVQLMPQHHDTGVDLIAEYRRSDPFGAEIREVYLVQVKLYRQSRADLKFLNQSIAYLKSFPQADEILLVTNSQLTSAALEWLNSVKQKEKISVRVIDGTELKRLLLKHNDLVQKYFSADEEGES
jgi:restriction endonuclease Mrr